MKMLAHDALTQAVRVCRLVQIADLNIRSGNNAKAREVLAEANAIVTAELPIMRGVLSAQGQAAQALNLAQCPAVGLGVEPHEHPHANDDHLTTPETTVSPVA